MGKAAEQVREAVPRPAGHLRPVPKHGQVPQRSERPEHAASHHPPLPRGEEGPDLPARGKPLQCGGLVNFEKLRMIAKEIRHVVRMTSANMDPALMKKRWKSLGSLSQGSTNSNMLDVQGGAHKKRVRRSSLLNAKKLYEDAQMARKVKQYLSNLQVETDEEKFQIMSLQCEPAYSTLSKNLSERRSTKSDMSPVSLRSTLPAGKPHAPNRMSQVLQVPPVSLYPLRKKSTAKDIAAAHNSGSPLVVKKPPGSAEEWTTVKKASEDTLSTGVPEEPLCPPGLARKGGGVPKSQNSSQMNLSGSSSSLTSEASTKGSGSRSYGIGYALMPAGKSDNLSDSSHSEISSRSSIVSNCSVDSMPILGAEERCQSKASCPQDTPAPGPAPGHAHPVADYSQPCSSAALARVPAAVARAASFTASASHEELAPDHNLPPPPRGPWDLAAYRHAQLGGAIAEVEAGPARHDDAGKRLSRDSSELDQSRQSWASSSSLSDTYEGNYGTIKRRAAENAAGSPGETPDSAPGADPAYKTITSSTEKGLIVYCVTSPTKDDRFRGPPPTPPGYQGISLGDAAEGAPRPHLKPPDYSVALQRSKLLQSPCRATPCFRRGGARPPASGEEAGARPPGLRGPSPPGAARR
ncbi:hypothetical protein ANANG_G00149350 [Anguilla anguilla]|uniref:Rap guanine nucleotide exchange factor 6 n=1 Tax=Anguilla anguilla TaxID=7936 RepID=A0A9D3M6C6_ANGAN|nr:hypothetical protein ANANG_G00149350 [Anguilla anguilla]